MVMFFVWGSRLYGKVDEVPGMFHVATKFGHLWYFPLIPMGSHVILSENEDGWEGIKIPLSMKSVFVAWARAGLVVAALWAAFGMVAGFATAELIGGMVSGLGLAVAVALFFATKMTSISRADLQRARQIAQQAGFDEEGIQLLETHFMAMDALRPDPIQPR